jgi:GNAT superfamily N-acetyltransferase
MRKLSIIEADLSNKKHADAILKVTNMYARDPMGLGTPLPEAVKKNLITRMKEFPGTLCFIAFFDEEPAGVANCFYGFSTFNASKLINIHDLAVMPGHRGKGIGEALLAAVEEKGKEEGCCKITLEVREDNRAKALYERFGFSYGEPAMFFMSKSLL